jgi:transposase
MTPGDVQDRHIIAPLLAIARERFPSLKSAIADGGYQGKLTADEVQQQAGIPLEIVKRSDVAKGFHILPKRWIVERTYGWLGRPVRTLVVTCEPMVVRPYLYGIDHSQRPLQSLRDNGTSSLHPHHSRSAPELAKRMARPTEASPA